MACRKMSIYGAGHPTAHKAVEKPFLIAAGIFRVRRFLSLNVHKGDLFLMNIRLKDSPFTAQIIQFLQVLDVNAVLFDHEMSAQDFSFFIETITTRQMVYNASFSMTQHLTGHNVTTIQVNSELAYDLFERRKQYRGDVDGDFTVRRLALDQLGEDPVHMARVRNANEEGLLDLMVDFAPDVIGYLLPEKVASLAPEELRRLLVEMADAISGGTGGPQRTQEITDRYMSLFKLVDFHPQRDKIVADLDAEKGGAQGEPMSKTGAIKIETSARIDDLLERQFSMGAKDKEVEVFCEAFSRLLKTGQQPKASEIVSRLLDLMSAADPGYRQTALNLLGLTVRELKDVSDDSVLAAAVREVVGRLEQKTETYEFSELLWELFDVCRLRRRYDLAAQLTGAMAARRMVNDNVTVYDSMAVKKGFENISRHSTVRGMVEDLLKSGGEETSHLKDTLVAIGSEEVAVALSDIISHPRRQVRQLTLKVLAELGKAALKVFSRIVRDDDMFSREEGRHELPDEKWYVIRNSIFVLGSLRDPQAVAPLRIRIDDTDVRVRREIITALEKIGGEEAVDCLTLMAEDPISEVRDAAIIAIGLIGQPNDAPLLVDLAGRNPKNSTKVVTALGKLGGEEARYFLGELLNDPTKLADLAGGAVSKDELRLAVVKALGQIGDSEAITEVRRFQEAQSATQKILFRNSAINKAVNDVLSRH